MRRRSRSRPPPAGPDLIRVPDLLDRLRAPLRGLGRDRLAFLGLVTGGHTVIHWYQQIFAVVRPSLAQGFTVSDIQVGYLQSARPLTGGTMNLPVGRLADSLGSGQTALLASALGSARARHRRVHPHADQRDQRRRAGRGRRRQAGLVDGADQGTGRAPGPA